jgi:hypothetical protein
MGYVPVQKNNFIVSARIKWAPADEAEKLLVPLVFVNRQDFCCWYNNLQK